MRRRTATNAARLLVLVLLAGATAATSAEREHAITSELEGAVEAGLAYLARTQEETGSWKTQYGREPGVVGLAVMSFLAHGHMPDDRRYGHVIRRGVDYILSRQQENGLLGQGGRSMYSHGFATLALAEVYGVVDDDRIGPALSRAVGLIVSSQNPQGGWRYSPTSRDADTTVSGAQVMALRAAANAGIEVPRETVEKAVEYYKSCFCPGGGYGYTSPGGPSNARAGIGMLVLELSGHYRDPQVKATAQWILDRMGSMPRTGHGYYATYYCSQAMYQAGGRYWRAWNRTVTPAIVAAQASDGHWRHNTGPVCDTAFALLSLEINYDLLPIYQR